MKFKLNWGTGIVIAISGFMSFIIILSVKMLNNNTELVRKDYYQIAENFQNRIDARNNLTESGFIPQIKTLNNQIITPCDSSLATPTKPSNFRPKPTNPNFDFELSNFEFQNNNEMIFNTQPLDMGIWNLECFVNVGKTEYFFNKKLIIN